MAEERRKFHNIQKVDIHTYKINKKKLKRFDSHLMIFNRILLDENWSGYKRSEREKALKNIKSKAEGYSRIDYALSEAAWTLHDVWLDAFKQDRISRPQESILGSDWYKDELKIKDSSKMSINLKKAAKFFGADLVGIAKLNRDWLFKNWGYSFEPINFKKTIKNVIVLGYEMEEIGLSTSPTAIAGSVTALGYSRSAFTTACLSEFIRNLGYEAYPACNDAGLSIPLAIDAGLGQLGRNGLLITPEYGPRVQLSKIFTSLPLEPDKPIDFGVEKTCRICRRCAKSCKANAISLDEEPTYSSDYKSSSQGTLKWYVDGEKCYEFWCDNGTDCSDCIVSCPYSATPVHVTSEEFWKKI
ncbi:reductive dehalogenase [Candidatus Bathyarchaeota archaeon]|nr:reductive dehalogenase [Candidatus Bathyarchaeota archaeon]